jgi:nucleotide-binding universal stress UspA family protein
LRQDEFKYAFLQIPNKRIQNMKALIAIDCSASADSIVEVVGRRPWARDSKLKVVTVVETTGHWDSDQEHCRQVEAILKQRMELLRSHLPAGVQLSGEVVEGHAAEAVNEAAKLWKCDQIIIGSHGDTGIRRSGLGSIAAKIVNTAPCSVEVLKIGRTSDTLSGVTAQNI